jgi:hypothetical protein
VWTNDAMQLFKQLKQTFVTNIKDLLSLLKEKRLVLYRDASDVELGSVLTQNIDLKEK